MFHQGYVRPSTTVGPVIHDTRDMWVDVSCKKCGDRKRLDIGAPSAAQSLEEYVRLVVDRLAHQPSFGCFGGHFELAPPVPRFWDVHWDTLGEQ